MKNHFKNDDKVILRKISSQLRARRARLGMSQREVATKSGVTREHISRIENNQVLPNIATLRKISTALGVTIVFFFKEGGHNET